MTPSATKLLVIDATRNTVSAHRSLRVEVGHTHAAGPDQAITIDECEPDPRHLLALEISATRARSSSIDSGAATLAIGLPAAAINDRSSSGAGWHARTEPAPSRLAAKRITVSNATRPADERAAEQQW